MNERERFEAWFAHSRKGKGKLAAANILNRLGDDTYASDSTQRHWWTWQAAALQASESPAETVAWEVTRLVRRGGVERAHYLHRKEDAARADFEGWTEIEGAEPTIRPLVYAALATQERAAPTEPSAFQP